MPGPNIIRTFTGQHICVVCQGLDTCWCYGEGICHCGWLASACICERAVAVDIDRGEDLLDAMEG